MIEEACGMSEPPAGAGGPAQVGLVVPQHRIDFASGGSRRAACVNDRRCVAGGQAGVQAHSQLV
jgi:hypothetical protein